MMLTILIPCRDCDRLVIVESYRCFAPRPICEQCVEHAR